MTVFLQILISVILLYIGVRISQVEAGLSAAAMGVLSAMNHIDATNQDNRESMTNCWQVWDEVIHQPSANLYIKAIFQPLNSIGYILGMEFNRVADETSSVMIEELLDD